MVQDFGKGKSHFALTVANFFKQPAGSPEVEGILHQIQFATSEQSLAIYERLKAYKERTKPYLVICISGEVQADLGKMLIQALRSALEEHGIEDAIAQHFIQQPLTYLKGLSAEKRTQAQQYLKQIGQPHGDLDMMIELLAEDNYDIIPTVVELSEHLEGFAFNFEYNLNLEEILEDVIENLCTGEAPQFEGILLLFDELNAYLRTWLKNPQAAGNYALQNITNVCGRHRGKIALLCLAQIKPSLDTQVPTLDRKNYERFTSRIELAPSTYEPKSSLELVIDNLLRQSEGFQWQAFHDRWGNTLLGESRSVYEKYITAYKPNDSSLGKFHQHLGLGCYPLHPLTAYLLCNLEFTQGRTAIQFIKEDVVTFIDSTPVEVEGRLKLVRPVQLMDAFKSNFAQQSFYNDYQKAYDAIAASANPEEITVLKAIGLYYLSGDKITKPSHEHHGDILAVMTGFSINKTKYILTQLTDEYQVIYYNVGNKTYRFYSGFSLNDLRRKLEDEIAERTPQLNELIKECRKNLSHYLGSETIRANEFVNAHRLHSEEWQFEQQIFAIDQFERLLTTERLINGLTERGLIAYFIGEYESDLEEIETKAEDVLASAPQAVQERVILAIPQKGTGNLSRVLLMRDTLHKKNIREKQEFGPALAELVKQFDEQLINGLQDIFESCVYTCRAQFSTNQWRDLMFCSMGYNPQHPNYTHAAKTWILARLLPLVEANYHLMELAPKGTGKSYVYENISSKVSMVSGGKITRAQLFFNARTREVGLLGRHDVVVLDEVQSLTFDNPDEVIGPLKTYLASNRYNCGGYQDISSDCSLMLLANIELDDFLQPKNPNNLVVDLPDLFSETALLDRFAGIIPGWKIPKFTYDMAASGAGLKMDFFWEALLSLRRDNRYFTYAQQHSKFDKSATVRDQNAILKSASGFLKILYPHLKLTVMDYERDCLKPACELRQAIRDAEYTLDDEFRQLSQEICVEAY